MFITTDTLVNDRLYLMIIQESINATNRFAPSFAIVYINNGIWTNLQKASDSKISSITQSGGKITITLSEKRHMYIGILGLGY